MIKDVKNMTLKPVSLPPKAPPSKILICLALFCTFLLPYLLLNKYPRQTTTTYLSYLPPIKLLLNTNEIHMDNFLGKQNSLLSNEEIIAQSLLKSPSLQRQNTTTSNSKVQIILPLDPEKKWTIATSKEDDSVAKILQRLGFKTNIYKLIKNNNNIENLKIKAHQDLQFITQNNTLEKILLPLTTTKYLLIYQQDNKYKTTTVNLPLSKKETVIMANVQSSLYATAKKYNIPYKFIGQMIEIFRNKINFTHKVHSNDRFIIIYENFYRNGQTIKVGDILVINYISKKQNFTALRYITAKGEIEYFTPKGLNLKQAFNRYPVNFTHISSTFNLQRLHPILHYVRPHKGVDLAAPLGTPIHATGDGKITIIGRTNGYGNTIKITHNKTFSTLYGHMLKFQRGLSEGSFVKRGQIIGFVGQSGLATAPHCHYEFRINNKPKNPTTLDLPTQLPLSKKELTAFKNKITPLLAKLQLHQKIMLAQKDTYKQ